MSAIAQQPQWPFPPGGGGGPYPGPGNGPSPGPGNWPHPGTCAPLLVADLPNYGPASGGTAVLLLGIGLQNLTQVTFDGIPATILIQDPLGFPLVVAAPQHAAGTVQIVATTPWGDSNPLSFTYVAAPTVLTLKPAQGPAAGGTSFTITGTNLTGATVTFGGVPATQVTVSGNGTMLTGLTPAGTGNVPVVVTTTSGSATVTGGFTYL